MYRCELCNLNLFFRNKTKHNQSKKQKYYANLILNRYVIKNVKVIKFKNRFNPYFNTHTRKFNSYTVHITLRDYEGDPLSHKIIVSMYVTYNIQSEHYNIYSTESASDFLQRVISIYYGRKSSTKNLQK